MSSRQIRRLQQEFDNANSFSDSDSDSNDNLHLIVHDSKINKFNNFNYDYVSNQICLYICVCMCFKYDKFNK